jgi:aryl-alcohol dehydrogenase-like predicted oxidoreductase
MTAVEGSLRRLQTDYIDLYYAHRPWYEGDPEETLRAFDDLVRGGKVRYIACSNYPAWWLMKALWISDVQRLPRFVCVQPKYNLVYRAEFERELMAVCQDQGLAVAPYSPQAAGVLTGKYRRGGPEPAGPRADTVKSYLTERTFAVVDRLQQLADARGKSVAQMALTWLLTRPGVTSAIVGANTLDQLRESIGAVGLKLTGEEYAEMNDLTNWSD